MVRRPAIDDARDRRLFDRITLRGLSEERPRQGTGLDHQATRSNELPTILTVARETGMRRSEVVGIQREHLDLMHGVIHLPHQERRARDVPDPARARRYAAGSPAADAGRIRDAPGLGHARLHPRATPRPPALPVPSPTDGVPTTYFRDLRFHDLRHEGTSQLATVFQIHELAKVNGTRYRMLLRYYHPHGRELAQKLARSPLGKRQLEQLRRERLGRAGRSSARRQRADPAPGEGPPKRQHCQTIVRRPHPRQDAAAPYRSARRATVPSRDSARRQRRRAA